MVGGVIIYSGGMDSTTLLYHLHSQKMKLLALTFNYGSNHNKKEIECAKYHCEKLGIEHIIIPLDFFKYFKSSLLEGADAIPEGHYQAENMKSTVVPFRNGIMLSIASGIAESKNFDNVFLASHAGDHAIYPDCRVEFTEAMNQAVYEGTYNHVDIKSPYNILTKREIALIGLSLGIDYSKTWTCYKGEEEPCGVCGSCVERREALP